MKKNNRSSQKKQPTKRPNVSRRAPKSRRSGGTNRNRSGTVMLSPCASHYAKAISEPWHPAAMGACVPKVPARPSRKVTTFNRQTAYTGTAGYGFVAIIPSTAGNAVSLLITTSSFTGTSTSGVTSATTGVSSYTMSNLPATTNTFSEVAGNSNAAARIVSVGASIQYTGTVLNQGGYYRAFIDPDHDNLLGANSGAALNTSAETSYMPITQKKRFYAMSAVDTSEYEYNNVGDIWDWYPLSNRKVLNATDTSIGGAPMLIEFVSSPGNPFFIEVVQHSEYTGNSFQGALTPSHADATGFETVAAAAALVPSIRKASPDIPYAALMDMALKATVASLKPIAHNAAKAGLAYMSGNSLV